MSNVRLCLCGGEVARIQVQPGKHYVLTSLLEYFGKIFSKKGASIPGGVIFLHYILQKGIYG